MRSYIFNGILALLILFFIIILILLIGPIIILILLVLWVIGLIGRFLFFLQKPRTKRGRKVIDAAYKIKE